MDGDRRMRLLDALKKYLGGQLDEEVGSSKWDEPEDKPDGLSMAMGGDDGEDCPECGGKHAPGEPHQEKGGGADKLAALLGGMK